MRARLAVVCAVLLVLSALPCAAGVLLEGRVVTTGGAPVAGAQVSLMPSGGDVAKARAAWSGRTIDAVARGTSDASGAFRIDAPAGYWSVRIEAAGYVPVESAPAALLEETVLADALLLKDATLTVTVHDGAKPVAGALVELAPAAQRGMVPAPWLAASVARVTGADGTVKLPRGAEPVHVIVIAPGHPVEDRAAVHAATLAVALQAGVELPLEVQGAAQKPAAGAVVLAGRAPAAFTDAEGHASLWLAAGQRARVEVIAPDGARDAADVAAPVASNPPAAVRTTTLRLVAPTLLRGKVLDESTHKPIAGALAWEASAAAPATTDASGAFALAVAQRGRYTLHAAASGYLSETLQDARTGSRAAAIGLRPAAQIEGKVTDASGRPIARAEVRADVVPSDPMRMLRRVRTLIGRTLRAPVKTRDDGSFKLLGVDPEWDYDLRATARGYAPAEHPVNGLVPRRAKTGVVIALARGAAITGSVADLAGAPVAGADVTVMAAPKSGARNAIVRAQILGARDASTATTGADGTFNVADLAPGTYAITVRHAGHAGASVPSIDLIAGPAPVDVGKLVLAPADAFEGTVVDGAGQPVDGASIAVSDAMGGGMFPGAGLIAMIGGGQSDAVSGPDGRFTIGDRKRGDRVDLRVQKDGYAPQRVPGVTVPPPSELVVTLHATSRVAGRVLDASERPVAHARVTARGARNRGPGMFMQGGRNDASESDDDGAFVLDGLEPGKLTLHVEADGYETQDVAAVDVPEGKALEGIVVTLQAGAWIDGRVTLADGSPASGARVSLAGDDSARGPFGGGGMGGIATDGDGNYHLDGLRAGQASIEAQLDPYPRAVRDVQLTRGANRLDLQIAGGQEVSGFVRDEGGAPVARADVRLALGDRGFGGNTATSADDGSFRVSGVTDGDYLASAARDGYAASDAVPVKVSGQPVAGVVVVLRQGGAIAGTISGIDPQLFPKVQVAVSGQGGGPAANGGLAQPDASGAFRVEHLAPGDWTLTATLADSGRRARTVVTLPAGQAEVRGDLAFPPGVTLSGHVMLQDAPLADAFVGVRPTDPSRTGNTTRTAYDGGFRIEGLEAGAYTVMVNDPQRSIAHTEPVTLDSDRDLSIAIPLMKVSGRVLDATDRSPVQGAAMSLVPDAGSGPIVNVRGSAPVETDASGAFVLENVTAGSYRVSAKKTGYAVRDASVVVSDGVDASNVELLVEATDGLTLLVRLPSGAPPDEVFVAVLGGAGNSVASGRYPTGENGRVRLGTVPAGAWEVLVGADGGATVDLSVTAPGAPVSVNLPAACTLDVTVPALLASGSGSVTLTGSDGRPFKTVRGFGGATSSFPLTRGRLHLTTVPPGSWTIQVSSSDGKQRQGNATTQPGAPAAVTISD